MTISRLSNLFFIFFVAMLLNGCANGKFVKSKPFKHNTPLIKDDLRKTGKAEIQKTLEMGPKPIEGDTRKLGKRKKISSQSQEIIL